MKIKFLCINLWMGGNLMDEIIAFIKKEDPDIIAMQEVYDGHDKSWARQYRSMDVFKQELDYKYNHFAPTFLNHRDIGKIEQGNAVFSKFSIKSTDITFYDQPYNKNYEEKKENFPFTPRNLQRVVVDIDGKELNVFNTQGIWGTDGDDNERRLKMSKTIIEQIKGKDNIILTGDFNVQENTQTINNIEKYLTNIFKGEFKTTFNMPRKINPGVAHSYKASPKDAAGFAEAVIDFIFVSPDMKVVEHSSPEVDVSDHKPLLAVLDI